MAFLHKKSLGQNFLNNPHVPRAMADAAHVKKGDVVLEIGPGTGALTRELLARGAKVIAIEADPRALGVLRETFQNEITGERLTLVPADVKTLELSTLGLAPYKFKVVANIPYYLSGFLFRRFLDTDLQPSVLVFLVQKEVAERIARSKKESLLSLSVKAFGDPTYVKTIKRGNFSPQPAVDSAVLAVYNISSDRLRGLEAERFFELLHAGFASKRKQLIGNLSKKHERGALLNIFSTLNLPTDVRAEDVPIEIWLELCRKITLHTTDTAK